MRSEWVEQPRSTGRVGAARVYCNYVIATVVEQAELS